METRSQLAELLLEKDNKVLSPEAFKAILKIPFLKEFNFVLDGHYYCYQTFLEFLITAEIITVYDPQMTFEQIYDQHFFNAMFCDETI